MAVCSGGALLPGNAQAAGPHSKPGILAERGDLDLRLQTALIDQPRWLRSASDESDDAGSSVRLFLTARGRQAAATESADVRRVPSGLGVRGLPLPVQKVAAEHLLTRSVFLQLSVGLDRERERGGIGEITPSVGLQFERRFQ